MEKQKLKNLYDELKTMFDGDSPEDVISWVSVQGRLLDTNEFLTFAKQFNYDSGFGDNEIDLSLTVFLKNRTWLERREYDGSEWFVFCKVPTKPSKSGSVEQIRNLY